jgi:signal transduction histidine kinase
MSIFLTHPFKLEGLLKLWQLNTIVLLVCVAVSLVIVFRGGFMGLRLSKEVYNWDTNMNIVNTGAEYTNHMLKNQATKMELCIERLKTQFYANNDDRGFPEELAILSRSITSLKEYVDKIKRHTQSIRINPEPCNLIDLIEDSVPALLKRKAGIKVSINVNDNISWICDKTHITEAFSNILTNAAEAIQDAGSIGISCEYEKPYYLLIITDTGKGMDGDTLKNAFSPYFTTKNTDRNFGLGLAYCKNVIVEHGGAISAVSKPSRGTQITISIPSKKMIIGVEHKSEGSPVGKNQNSFS